MTATTPDVATVSKEAAAMHAAVELPRTLMGGSPAMRKAGTKYLPQEAKESKAAYESRLARSFLFNAFSKTVMDMTGKVFTKPVVLKEDVPAEIVEWSENIDQAGRHINVFAADVFTDSTVSGIGFILTDMPPALPVGTTLADEQAAGQRPYLVFIPVERVLGWKSTMVAGAETLTQFRFKEYVKEPDGEFIEKEIEQVRVLEPGKWQTWRKGIDEKWAHHENGTTSLNKIAVSPVYINRTEFMQGTPRLANLAELNVAHWQSSSDQRNILHVARVPILFMAGFNESDSIAVGASEAVRSSDANAKMGYVEHTGAAIGSGQTDIDKLEQQMQAMGLQLLIDAPGGQTATGEIRDDSKENSPLAMSARALGDALEQSLGFMAEFAKLGDSGGSVVVNTDFGIQAGAGADALLLKDSAVARLISKDTYWAEMQRRGVLSDDFDPDVEKDRIESEAPELTAAEPMDLNDPPPALPSA